MNSTGTLKRLTRRVGLSIVSVIAIFGLGTTLASPASAASLSNTAKSSTGAYLQSSGICDGGFNFTVNSQNFEYIAVGVVDSANNVTWTEWTPVEQNTRFTQTLPGRRLGLAYEVVGADDVGGQWEYQTVATSFDFILAGDNYSNNWC